MIPNSSKYTNDQERRMDPVLLRSYGNSILAEELTKYLKQQQQQSEFLLLYVAHREGLKIFHRHKIIIMIPFMTSIILILQKFWCKRFIELLVGNSTGGTEVLIFTSPSKQDTQPTRNVMQSINVINPNVFGGGILIRMPLSALSPDLGRLIG